MKNVCGLVKGNCPMNKYMFRLGITDSPWCKACLSLEETPLHVLTECEELINIKAQYLGDMVTWREIIESLQKSLNL